ncbi:MAG: FecR family protein, partial [Bacteroidetes bacterium]|nr:FecR family protein [Bacteroidota bacterium]
MHISEELIERFLKGKCTEEERQVVSNWFRENPDQLDRFMTQESWNSFSTKKIDQAVSDRMFKKINERIQKKPIAVKRIGWLVAASLLLLIGLRVSVIFFHRSPSPVIVQSSVAPKSFLVASEKNDQPVPKKITLPDGSIVTLSTGSSISYNNPFTENRRDIYLTGEANFKVAKDASKPFCVHSKQINTTALGTVFTVKTDGVFTSVKLFEGKVVIRNEDKTSKMKDVYLSPGHELLFNNENFFLAVQPFKTENNGQIKKNDISRPLLEMNFNNEPLQDVFKNIQKQYHVKIKYDSAMIKNMSFTGTYKPAS